MVPETPREEHARQWLAGLILVGITGTATLWWITGFYLALAYAAGFSTPIIWAKTTPTYSAPDTDSEEREYNRGVQ